MWGVTGWVHRAPGCASPSCSPSAWRRLAWLTPGWFTSPSRRRGRRAVAIRHSPRMVLPSLRHLVVDPMTRPSGIAAPAQGHARCAPSAAPAGTAPSTRPTHRQHCPPAPPVSRHPGERCSTTTRHRPRRHARTSTTAWPEPCPNTSCSIRAPPHPRSRPMTTTPIPPTVQPSTRRAGRADQPHACAPPTTGEWRAQVQATGGCAAPIHLRGSSRVLDRDGAVLLERTGTVLAPCGNRRAAVCPACSDRYAADAYHLLRAGLAGDDTKDVPDTVTDAPAGVPHPDRAVVRAGAHPHASPRAGTSSPAAAANGTTPTTPASAPPLDPDSYDYEGAVLWQAHAGMLWARFTTALRRALAAALGVTGARVPRPRPAVLRQGRRVPAPRPRALPRRHPPRRPRRTHRPTTRRARPRPHCGPRSPPPPAPRR